ncbi:arginine vasopressin-induced protein 1 isoform X1 [Pseudopipra pipra]|uniref:arginine vasopressin-induced protein 1 isoform X1 n=2 Tax=Pseudopipra pipra TaxID=415032 RepID=UPI003139EBE5
MSGARGSGGTPARWREASPGAQRVLGGPATARSVRGAVGRGAAAERKWVTAGPSALGQGGTGLACASSSRGASRVPGRPRPRGWTPAQRPSPPPALPHRASAQDPRGGGPGRAARAKPDTVSSVPAAAGAMGTPASVASDPPGRAAPAARGRKRASANIFQGVGLLELRSLFQSGGAERPEERARLVWRYAGQRRMARALRRLRRRRTARPGGGMAALRRFGHLRIAEKELESDCRAQTGSGAV